MVEIKAKVTLKKKGEEAYLLININKVQDKSTTIASFLN
jgi:hypothetical protein